MGSITDVLIDTECEVLVLSVAFVEELDDACVVETGAESEESGWLTGHGVLSGRGTFPSRISAICA